LFLNNSPYVGWQKRASVVGSVYYSFTETISCSVVDYNYDLYSISVTINDDGFTVAFGL